MDYSILIYAKEDLEKYNAAIKALTETKKASGWNRVQGATIYKDYRIPNIYHGEDLAINGAGQWKRDLFNKDYEIGTRAVEVPPGKDEKMKLNDKENLEFMRNPERLKAEAEMRKAEKHIQEIAECSIQTILVKMPQALKNLQQAYEEYNITEAKLEYGIIERRKNHD